MTYKITQYFLAGAYGFSESYWWSGSTGSSPFSLLPKMLSLRMAMMFDYIGLAGVRVSILGQQRASYLLLAGENNLGAGLGTLVLPVIGTYLAATPSQSSDQIRACMQVRALYGNGYKAIRYMVGPPEVTGLATTGGLIPNAHPKWYDQWIAYRDFLLKNGFGMLARSTVPPYNPAIISTLVVGGSTSNLIGVVVPGQTPAPGVPPGQIQISRCRPPKGTRQLSLNGLWMVDSVISSLNPASTTYFLAGSAGILPSAVRLTPKSSAQIVNPIFQPWTGLNVLRIGIHKRGRPSLVPRGRQLKRATLDP